MPVFNGIVEHAAHVALELHVHPIGEELHPPRWMVARAWVLIVL